MTQAQKAPTPLVGQLLAPRRTAQSEPDTALPETGNTLADDPLARVLAASNPLLEASRGLLRALSEISFLPLSSPATLNEGIDALRETLVRDIHQFQYLCDRAGFRREHVVTVKYCLCTALDEAVYKLSDRGENWAYRSLLLLFHNETSGGEKFFLLLGHMVQSPGEYVHVLEILYHILSLGFEGRYALASDGARQLETIHRRLLAIISERTEPVQAELSPHWQGGGGGRMHFMRTIPVWVTACVAALLLLAVFTSKRTELEPKSLALSERISKLARSSEQPASLIQDEESSIESWFSQEEQQRFNLQVHAAEQMLRIAGSFAFVNGTQMHADMAAMLDIVAKKLQKTQRSLMIVGHTDNTPLRTGSIFRDNQHLSEARAETIVNELVRRGVDERRLKALGKSDTVRLADNDTAKGRAQNRRVEMTLLRTGGKP